MEINTLILKDNGGPLQPNSHHFILNAMWRDTTINVLYCGPNTYRLHCVSEKWRMTGSNKGQWILIRSAKPVFRVSCMFTFGMATDWHFKMHSHTNDPLLVSCLSTFAKLSDKLSMFHYHLTGKYTSFKTWLQIRNTLSKNYIYINM